jgi:THUMP domain-like/RNA cap guanine-N2 methyltransferase
MSPETALNEVALLESLKATPAIFERLQKLSGPELHRQAVLRKEFSDDLVRLALSLAELRTRGAAKFSRAQEMWFDRVGLEQSTAEAVAMHKALRFTRPVFDICSGIGGDALALAQRVPVIAIDTNPVNLWRLKQNLTAYGVVNNLSTECGDAVELFVGQPSYLEKLATRHVHIDPDRRPGSGGRMQRVEDYVPGLDFLHFLQQAARGGAIKLGPASNFGGKFTDVETELISLNGECKEATLWFGELRTAAEYRATVLPAGETICGHPLQSPTVVTAIGRYVYDPDPAVVRAGLVDVLAEQLGFTRLDDAEEYLTSDAPITTPFAQRFKLLDTLPNNKRELTSAVKRLRWGQAEIKCRHVPVDATQMRKQLPLEGGTAGVVIVARLAGKTKLLLAERDVN